MSRHTIGFRQTQPRAVKLDELLYAELPSRLQAILGDSEVSRSKIRRLIIAGAVAVNGRQARTPSASVSSGSSVSIAIDTERFTFERQPDDIAFEMSPERILFEDGDIIVVDKPAGIPTEATIVASRDHLHAALKRYLWRRDGTRNEPYVGLHHRLDRETSGVILFTKNREINAEVFALFEGHEARKEYEALSALPPNESARAEGERFSVGTQFSVDNRLGRISAKSAQAKWGAVGPEGSPAHTDFKILERFARAVRVLAQPLTGRTHQIRVHLSSVGLPLLGDPLYGGPSTVSGTAIPRVMLHARALSFPHPRTGTPITVNAPLPADFLACIEALRR